MPEDVERLLAQILGARLGTTGELPAEATRFVRRCAAEAGVEPVAWLRTIESRPSDLRELIAAATVPHTAFYRHPEQIAQLRAKLPELARRSRSVRIWSAGCATGEEPWTIALVAAELGVDVQILATDVNERAIEKAVRGEYGRRETRSLPGFDGTHAFIVPDELRAAVRFKVGSLLSRVDDEPGPFDLIFCRNVLIYFDASNVDRAWATFERKLALWGAVVVAPVEALLRIPATFQSQGPLGWFERVPPPIAAAAPEREPSAGKDRQSEPAGEPSVALLSLEQVARLLRRDALDDAERLLHAILATRDDALGWFLLGETCARRGERTQAKIAYERAAKATLVPDEADLDTVRSAAIRRARQLGD